MNMKFSVDAGEHSLPDVINEIDYVYELAEKNVLKNEFLKEVISRTKNSLNTAILDFPKDSLTAMEYERDRGATRYSLGYPPPYRTIEHAKKELEWMRRWAVRILEEQGQESHGKQNFINKGNFFTGRKLLRSILEQATTTIDIQDNYAAHIAILNIVEPYVNVNIRILAGNVSTAFKSDLEAFNKQYNNAVELRTHNNAHDRFIIIDQKDVYSSGPSFKDLGNKAGLVSQVTDETARQKAITEFNDWFTNGVIIP